MNTIDLRIGNHVIADGKVVKICAIMPLKIGYRTNPTHIGYRYLSDCHPIMLTDELLERLGFILIGDRFVKSVTLPDFIYIEKINMVEYQLCTNTLNYRMKKKIEYLHELETYHRLFTNTELKINEL